MSFTPDKSGDTLTQPLNPNPTAQPAAPTQPQAAPAATPQAAPTQAQPVSPAPQPQAQPQAQPQDKYAALPKDRRTGLPVQDNSDHLPGLFRTFFEGMGGGPVDVMKTDPTTGQTYIQRSHLATKKSIAAGILAGALTGMAKGMQASAEVASKDRPNPGAQAAAALAGGFQGQQEFGKNLQGQAQKQSDEAQLRSYAVMNHNMETHKQELANHRAGLENADLEKKMRDADVEEAGPYADAIIKEAFNAAGVPIQYHYMTDSEIFNEMHGDQSKINATRDASLPVETVATVGPDGQTHYENKRLVFNAQDAFIKVNDKLADQFPELFSKAAPGQQVHVMQLLKMYTQAMHENSASIALQNIADTVPSQPKDVAKVLKDPMVARYSDILSQQTGHTPLELEQALNKAGVPGTVTTKILNALDYKGEYGEEYWKNKAKVDEQRAVHPEQAPATQMDVANAVSVVQTLKDLPDDEKKVFVNQLAEQGDKSKADVNKIQTEAEAANDRALQRITNAQMRGAFNPNDPDSQKLVDQIGTGHMTAKNLAQMLARQPMLAAAVASAYPDFDSSKAQAYPDIFKDYTSGNTSKQLKAGDAVLKHLWELKNLNTITSRIPGTKAYNAYQNKLVTVSDELANFYGTNTVSGISDLRGSLDHWFNRDAAIDTQVESFGDRLNTLVNSWNEAAPSKAYEAPMPGHLSSDGQIAYKNLNPAAFKHYEEMYESSGTPAVREDAREKTNQTPRPYPKLSVSPDGKPEITLYDPKDPKRIIGYSSDGKTITRLP